MSDRLIDRLSKDQIEAIFDALPIEFTYDLGCPVFFKK